MMLLDDSWHRAGIWRAGEIKPEPGQSTGFPMLDSLLPNQGWPPGALTEILAAHDGIGALRLVLPGVAAVSNDERWAICVCPPHIPYVPALQAYDINFQRLLIIEPEEGVDADDEYRLWVFEQALRFQQCGIALVWLEAVPQVKLRRLQLACEAGRTCGIVFRPEMFAEHPSPAALRLTLKARDQNTVAIHIIKSRGHMRERVCELEY